MPLTNKTKKNRGTKISQYLKGVGKWSGEDNPKWSGGKQERACELCGKLFCVRSKSHPKRYCSRSCSGKVNSSKKSNLGKCRGVEHWNWRGGVTTENHAERESSKYEKWRTAVFERDGYVCAVCESDKPRINAHHILEWANYKGRRYEVDNGVTLCTLHHQLLHPNIVLTDTRKYFLRNGLLGEL